jgi:hypothetical protein
MILLTSDWHLDSEPKNDYRWNVFDFLIDVVQNYEVSSVLMLGDVVDHRDRHPAVFVNRFIGEMSRFGKTRKSMIILKGNHEVILQGSSYWEFLNMLRIPIRYITEPTPQGDAILLPFTPTPAETWSGIDFRQYRAAFMHVTPHGAVGENGFELTGNRLPEFPESLKIYTGDVHVPQQIGQFTVVGCPHPVKFGDKFPPRMLLIDERSFEIVEEIPITTVSKRVVDVSSVEELRATDVRKGDQVKVRYRLATGAIEGWGQVESQIAAWAKTAGVTIAGVEVDVESSGTGSDTRRVDAEVSPDILLREFAVSEGVTDDLLKVGLELLKEG